MKLLYTFCVLYECSSDADRIRLYTETFAAEAALANIINIISFQICFNCLRRD